MPRPSSPASHARSSPRSDPGALVKVAAFVVCILNHGILLLLKANGGPTESGHYYPLLHDVIKIQKEFQKSAPQSNYDKGLEEVESRLIWLRSTSYFEIPVSKPNIDPSIISALLKDIHVAILVASLRNVDEDRLPAKACVEIARFVTEQLQKVFVHEAVEPAVRGLLGRLARVDGMLGRVLSQESDSEAEAFARKVQQKVAVTDALKLFKDLGRNAEVETAVYLREEGEHTQAGESTSGIYLWRAMTLALLIIGKSAESEPENCVPNRTRVSWAQMTRRKMDIYRGSGAHINSSIEEAEM